MAGGLGSLVVRLGLDAAEFTGGLTKAEAQAVQASREIQRNLQTVGVALASIGTAAIGAAFGLSKIAESNAKFQDIAETIGDTAVNVSSLAMAAAQGGQGFDGIADFSIKLTKALTMQDEESKKAGAALRAIGLDFQELKKQSPVQQLEDIAKALAGYENGQEKTAVMEALAKGGAKLLPFLNDLAEQNERNSKLTQKQIDDSNEYTESLGRLKGSLAGAASVMAANLAPSMTALVSLFQKTVDYIGQNSVASDVLSGALTVLKTIFQTIAVVGANVGFVLGGIGREIGAVAAQLVSLASGDLTGFRVISESVKADGVRARKELDDFTKEILNPTPPEEKVKPILPKIDTRGFAPDKKVDKAPAAAASDYSSLNKRISESIALQSEQIKLGRELTKEEVFSSKLLADISLSKVALSASEVESLKTKIKLYNEQAAAINQTVRNKENEKLAAELSQKLNEQEALDITATIEAREKSDRQAGYSLAKKIEGLQFENTLIGLNTEQRQIAISLAEIERSGIKQNTDAYLAAKDSITAAVNEGKKLNDIQSRITEISEVGKTVFAAILSGAEKPLDALKKLLKRDLINTLYELTAKKWVIGIATSNAKSGGGDLLSTLFSSFLGGGKANGGSVSAGGVYPFLERGTPETVTAGGKTYLFTGSKNGVVNNKVSAAQAGGGQSIVIHQSFDNRGADVGIAAKIAESARQTKAATIAAIQDMNRRSPAFLGR